MQGPSSFWANKCCFFVCKNAAKNIDFAIVCFDVLIFVIRSIFVAHIYNFVVSFAFKM